MKLQKCCKTYSGRPAGKDLCNTAQINLMRQPVTGLSKDLWKSKCRIEQELGPTCRKHVRRIGLYYHIHQNWKKIVCGRHGLLHSQGQKVHDSGWHPEDACDLVLRKLVRRQSLKLSLRKEIRYRTVPVMFFSGLAGGGGGGGAI